MGTLDSVGHGEDVAPAPARMRFGEFVLDVASQRLLERDREIALSPKAFRLLTLLARHPDEVLTKDRLLDEIWADVHVLEGVVKVCIAEIRKALGETAAQPVHLHTVQRRGYRFEGTVAADAESAPATPGPSLSTCTRCDASLPPIAEFCSACGEPRGRTVPRPPPTASPASGTPPGILPASPPPSRGEVRQVTVMACSLEVPADSSDALDADARETLERAFERTASALVRSQGGRAAPHRRHGLLFHFGFPVSHEDDPLRSLRAAARLLERMPSFAGRAGNTLPSFDNQPFVARVGIHTGPVVVGDVDANAIEEEGDHGDTERIAAELEAAAEPGAILVSEATRGLLRDAFALEHQGERKVEGRDRPIALYRVLQAREEAPVATANAGPMIGRDQELSLLVDRWDKTREGRGQAVLVSGEAGMGKSRLVQALRDDLDASPHTWIELHGSAFHRNTAFHLVADFLRRAFELGPDESPEEQVARIETGLDDANLPLDETLPLFTSLLALPLPIDHPPLLLSPELHRRRTLEAMCAWLLSLAEQRPLIVAVEDLHWADPSSLEFLGMLIEQVQMSPLMVVMTSRPEEEPAWSSLPQLAVLPLHPLTPEQVERLLLCVTAGKPVPRSVGDHIVAKADGVPLYVEELTKSVIESDLLADTDGRYERTDPLPEFSVPSTLTDSLEARLDRLGAGREVAQFAAVLGREFSQALIEAVSPFERPSLDAALDELVRSGLVYRRGLPPRASYAFKHALIQETAYRSLLRSTRRDHHAQIADAYETRLPELVEKQPEDIARHYEGAGNPAKAIAGFERAGRRAAERSAHAEAVAQYERALALIDRIPDEHERDQRELQLRIALGASLTTTRGFGSDEVEAAYLRARSLSHQQGDTAQLGDALGALATFYVSQSRLSDAREISDQLLGVAMRLEMPGHLAAAHYSTALTDFFRGELRTALRHFDEVGARREGAERPTFLVTARGENVDVAARSWKAWALWVRGLPDQAKLASQEAIDLARAAGHPFDIAYALAWAAAMLWNRRDREEALVDAEAAIEIAEEQGFPVPLGVARLQRLRCGAGDGDDDAQLAEGERVLGELGATGNRAGVPQVLCGIGEFCLERERPAAARPYLEAALAMSSVTGQPYWDAEIHRCLGEMLLQETSIDRDQAESHFRQALEIARGQGARMLELRAAMSLARLVASGDRAGEEIAELSAAYQSFEEGFETFDLREARRLLGAP